MFTLSLARLLERSSEFEEALLAEFPKGGLFLAGQEQRNEIAAAAALIAIEHAGALRVAAEIGAFNSAAGLLRLQFEAVLRAAWLLFAAAPGQVEKLTCKPKHQGTGDRDARSPNRSSCCPTPCMPDMPSMDGVPRSGSSVFRACT
ncbi:DUF6988 family protein [Ottowia sp.]|uniref:DUF6988 family protein n=1 Tax=Ottowia sp. TaxID=1898956 RepID=UPI003C792D0B